MAQASETTFREYLSHLFVRAQGEGQLRIEGTRDLGICSELNVALDPGTQVTRNLSAALEKAIVIAGRNNDGRLIRVLVRAQRKSMIDELDVGITAQPERLAKLETERTRISGQSVPEPT